MMAIVIWWLALPSLVRRLIGALFIAGATFAALVLWHHRAYTSGYSAGHRAGADSAWLAETKHRQVLLDSMEAVADSAAKIAQQGSAPLAAAKQHFDSAPRHTPRMEALTVPVTVDTSLVGVTVESTGEHFILPRAAARYWYVSDSLVGVAQQLLAKYAAANAQWRDAWTAEHEARIGADSLVAMYAERLRSVSVPPAAKPSRVKAVAKAVAWLGVGFFIAKHVR